MWIGSQRVGRFGGRGGGGGGDQGATGGSRGDSLGGIEAGDGLDEPHPGRDAGPTGHRSLRGVL